MKLDRRAVLAGAGALGIGGCVPLDTSPQGRLAAKLRLIEAGLGGALGVAFLDPVRRLTLGHRQDERFAMCSTFKTTLAALVLRMDAEGRIDGDMRVRWSEADLLSYAPFTRERLATGATVHELARAIQTLSDNTAANLLLARVGGPAAVTGYWRFLGDTVSRLDRTEGELNFVPAGEVRDTTTPAAMAATLARLLFGDGIGDSGRATLRQWMRETTTGLNRVRAGLPAGWVVGDKTGNSGEWPGMGYTRGDIGFTLAPTGDPVLFAAYHRAPITNPPTGEAVDAAFTEIGRTLAMWIGENYTIEPG